MGVRGRKSISSLTTVAPVQVIERIRAPHYLNDEETEVWASVVNTEPADWFSPSSSYILVQFCRNVVQANRIAELIERMTSTDDYVLEDYDRLVKLQAKVTDMIEGGATKMRLTQQSTINHRGNKRPTHARKPWETADF